MLVSTTIDREIYIEGGRWFSERTDLVDSERTIVNGVWGRAIYDVPLPVQGLTPNRKEARHGTWVSNPPSGRVNVWIGERPLDDSLFPWWSGVWISHYFVVVQYSDGTISTHGFGPGDWTTNYESDFGYANWMWSVTGVKECAESAVLPSVQNRLKLDQGKYDIVFYSCREAVQRLRNDIRRESK